MPPVERQKSALKGPEAGQKGGAPAAKQIGSLLAVIGDEDTVTGMLLAGIGNVDARRTSNFMVVDSKTTPAQVEESFVRFTKRSDIAVLIINQYIASMIRETIDNFVRSPRRPTKDLCLARARAAREPRGAATPSQATPRRRPHGQTAPPARSLSAPWPVVCCSAAGANSALAPTRAPCAGGEVPGHPRGPEQGEPVRPERGRHPPPHQAAARHP